MGALFLEQAANSEFIRFGHTPRHNSLSAHTVFKLLFPLQHQDLSASLGHRSGQCGSGDPAAYRNDVVAWCRHPNSLWLPWPAVSEFTWLPRWGRFSIWDRAPSPKSPSSHTSGRLSANPARTFLLPLCPDPTSLYP